MKDRELYNKTLNVLRTEQGRSVSGKVLPTVATCLSICARPGLTRKGHVMASSCNHASFERPKRDDGNSELDTGYISLPKYAHQMHGSQKFSVASASIALAHNTEEKMSMLSTDTTTQPSVTSPSTPSAYSHSHVMSWNSSHR